MTPLTLAGAGAGGGADDAAAVVAAGGGGLLEVAPASLSLLALLKASSLARPLAAAVALSFDPMVIGDAESPPGALRTPRKVSTTTPSLRNPSLCLARRCPLNETNPLPSRELTSPIGSDGVCELRTPIL